ncbi:MAG TPA: hypothetical protein VK550_11980 [Polyangiaceae bacterium]|nr:hypothetical protein [Polyangiaceae bacterium]
MKRHRSPYILVASAGVAALALSAAACSSSVEKSNGTLGGGVDALVFAKRMHTTVGDDGKVEINIGGGTSQVIDYGRSVPGGGVYILSPARQDGTLTHLTKKFTTADIAGLDLSFDAQEVVYSMKTSGDDHYHVYTQRLDGSEPSQRTFGESDDINPIYAPGDRIVFVTNEAFTEMGTRADEYNHGRVVTQLATITRDGGDADRKLCSQNLSHTVNPFLRYDGSIGYSRWEHLGGVNDVKLFRMAPDCTQMIHVAGQFGKPSNSLVQVTEISPNVMVGIATDRERTIQAGSLVSIDSRYYQGTTANEKKLDSEHVKYELLTPAVPTGSDQSPVGRYRTPHGLPDGRLVVSWADGVVNDTNELSETPPDFGIYVFDAKGNADKPNLLVYNDKDAWELYPIPVVARAVPPVIGSVQNVVDATLPATFGSLDIKQTDLDDDNVSTVQHYAAIDNSNQRLPEALHGAVRVRVIEGFSSEAVPGVTMFGLTMDEGAAVLGEATVYGDGSWLANIPPYVPVHLQPVDKFGLSIRNQRLWVQGMPGENRVCGGCHESRTGDNDLGNNQNVTVAAVQGAQNFVKPVAERQEYPWDGAPTGVATVQSFLTAKCATCHNDTQNGSKPQTFYTVSRTDMTTGMMTEYRIPYLSFSSTPIQVYYDRQVHTWASSYVSVFYPATLGMEMDGLTIVGDIPPPWGVPESARESVLIEKLNVKAADGTFAWDPATHPSHPEDVGVTISDEERQMLVRVMDLGGQYYARKNSNYQPYSSDPTLRNK